MVFETDEQGERELATLSLRKEDDTGMNSPRQAFGIEELDRELGGGLLPGTLTVVAGATGIGKTQLGLRWADAGNQGEGARGVICDLTSRGDSQNHSPMHALNWAGKSKVIPSLTRPPSIGSGTGANPWELTTTLSSDQAAA